MACGVVVTDTAIFTVMVLGVAMGRMAAAAGLATGAAATEVVGQRERGVVEAMGSAYLPGD